MMDSKKCNKIREVVRLQQILKKWKKAATSSASSNADMVPKGFLAVCVGKELQKFIIPTHYLRHQAFEMLLQEAQEEFGFQQEGVLKIPCHVSVFQKILKAVEDNKQPLLHHSGFDGDKDITTSYASDCEVTPSHHPQTCT
ncbi:hypothetical protein PHAVU_010G164600 [Phaseolus vulgaris]|uniref:Uncharacterized protein n=2 Tax=Phaseolus vulgaris TaxID=3885 RepID=V7AUG4_PHAVU|nr:hypothetical protein PHAVU_010G164600g [Phaseolus vulgaris]ESW07861.1 hypothetical protein PHAVU_010G164600g [Phaseolus vulgaris]